MLFFHQTNHLEFTIRVYQESQVWQPCLLLPRI